MTHTPRPWEDGSREGSIIAPLQEYNDTDKNLYGGYMVADYVSRHNKPLIKAAPDLLAALKALVNSLVAGLAMCDNGAWICGHCNAATRYASSDIEHRPDCAIPAARKVIASVMGSGEE